MKFAAVNLGCKVNHVELEAVSRALLGAGCAVVPEADADVIVVNTCTVTGEAERKTRKAVNRALAANAHAMVVVTGCSVALDAASFAGMDARVRVVPRAAMGEFLAEARAKAAAEATAEVAGATKAHGEGGGEGGENGGAGEAASCHPHERSAFAPTFADDFGLFRTRVGVKIQDGCDNACTYCIVHVARGRSVSMPRADILAQVAALAAQNTAEIVLTGINLGSYRDAQGGLTSLLRDCLATTRAQTDAGTLRFRLSSIEPTDITDDFIALLAEANGHIARHLHIPLQSGSSRVLHDMDRHYTADEYLALIARLRQAVPALALTTDVIVGFPGETDAEFDETCNLCRAAGFSKLHVFPYSMRAGTPAAARADQVPPHIKQARAATLRRLSDELRAADFAARRGTTEYVLAEDNHFGFTESYHRVGVPAAPAGQLVRYTFA